MYETFFDLKRRPFASTPDTAAYFSSPCHDESLALLKCCVAEGEGIGLLLGLPGTVKTLEALVETLEHGHRRIFGGGGDLVDFQSPLCPAGDVGESGSRVNSNASGHGAARC